MPKSTGFLFREKNSDDPLLARELIIDSLSSDEVRVALSATAKPALKVEVELRLGYDAARELRDLLSRWLAD